MAETEPAKRQRMPHVLTAAWLTLIAAERLSQCAAWTQHRKAFVERCCCSRQHACMRSVLAVHEEEEPRAAAAVSCLEAPPCDRCERGSEQVTLAAQSPKLLRVHRTISSAADGCAQRDWGLQARCNICKCRCRLPSASVLQHSTHGCKLPLSLLELSSSCCSRTFLQSGYNSGSSCWV